VSDEVDITFRCMGSDVRVIIAPSLLAGDSTPQLAAAREAMGEAAAMMRKSGVDPAAALEMLSKTIFAAPVYQGYGPLIAHGRFTPAGFRLPLGLKDIDLVLQTAAAANAPMPTASLLRDRFVSAIAKGRADLDWSAIALGAADDAGLKESR